MLDALRVCGLRAKGVREFLEVHAAERHRRARLQEQRAERDEGQDDERRENAADAGCVGSWNPERLAHAVTADIHGGAPRVPSEVDTPDFETLIRTPGAILKERRKRRPHHRHKAGKKIIAAQTRMMIRKIRAMRPALR
jgi:hypothetical protein